MTNKEEPHRYLDLVWQAKARGLFVSGAAGTGAAVTSLPVTKLVAFVITLPEFASALVSMLAFAHFAQMGLDYYWNKQIQPHHIVVRETKQSTFKI
ncbi:MAG TPA: hypothetical protein VIN59_04820 [Alphaproteobacteria bacterium]